MKKYSVLLGVLKLKRCLANWDAALGWFLKIPFNANYLCFVRVHKLPVINIVMVNEERSRKAAKRIVVAISSSSEEEEESFLESDDDNVSSESESEDDYNISGDSDDDVVEITSSPSWYLFPI